MDSCCDSSSSSSASTTTIAAVAVAEAVAKEKKESLESNNVVVRRVPTPTTMYYNILKLIEIRDRIVHCATLLNSDIQRHLQKAFIRWIFILNASGHFHFFQITSIEKFKEIVIQQIIQTGKERKILNINRVIEFVSFELDMELEMEKKEEKKEEEIQIHIQIHRLNPYILLYPDPKNSGFSGRSARIHEKQYNRLKSLFRNNHNKDEDDSSEDQFHLFAYLLGLFYTHVDCVNMHLSFPPEFLKENHIQFELFGTPLNTDCASFCSPLDFEQLYFQSKGSFFDLKLNEFRPHGIFTANPPFDEKIMLDMVIKLYDILQLIPITFYITIPAWDYGTKKSLGMTFKMERMQYNSFEAYDYLMKYYRQKDKKFIRVHRIHNVGEFNYYDYYNDRIRGIVPVHFFIVSSDPEFQK
jgi:hypothetical protein